jgi:2,3-dihydroxybenzoate decarboxylase
LTAPGVQSIPQAKEAIAQARRTNDYLAENIARNPKRLKGFAILPLQDPEAAAQELTRCIRDFGFCGALVNGFSQVGEGDSAVYYDLPQYRPFWATVQELDVPFYLHPRDPSSARQQCYGGYRWLAGSPWGFAVETSIHALRLMASGLFDEYPKLNVIVGHLGEGLSFGIWRVENRIRRGSGTPKAKLPMSQYLRENFYITTSGNFRLDQRDRPIEDRPRQRPKVVPPLDRLLLDSSWCGGQRFELSATGKNLTASNPLNW